MGFVVLWVSRFHRPFVVSNVSRLRRFWWFHGGFVGFMVYNKFRRFRGIIVSLSFLGFIFFLVTYVW